MALLLVPVQSVPLHSPFDQQKNACYHPNRRRLWYWKYNKKNNKRSIASGKKKKSHYPTMMMMMRKKKKASFRWQNGRNGKLLPCYASFNNISRWKNNNSSSGNASVTVSIELSWVESVRSTHCEISLLLRLSSIYSTWCCHLAAFNCK